MFAESLLLLYASAHRTLCADISAQILYDICNSTLCAINYLRRSIRMTSLCLACAVGRPHSHYSKGSSSFYSIDFSLLWNHSPCEWFSLYNQVPAAGFCAPAAGTAVMFLPLPFRHNGPDPRRFSSAFCAAKAPALPCGDPEEGALPTVPAPPPDVRWRCGGAYRSREAARPDPCTWRAGTCCPVRGPGREGCARCGPRRASRRG